MAQPDCLLFDITKSEGSAFQFSGMFTDAGKQEGIKVVSEPAKLLGRTTSRSKSGSGAVRSDYEEQLIMSQLQAAERMRSQLVVRSLLVLHRALNALLTRLMR